MAQDFSLLRRKLKALGVNSVTNKSLVSLVNYIKKNYPVLPPIQPSLKRKVLLSAFEVCKKHHETVKRPRNKNALLSPDDLLKNTRTESIVIGIKLISYYLYYEQNLTYSDISVITKNKLSKIRYNVLVARDYILDDRENYIKTMYGEFLQNLSGRIK